MAWLIYAAPLYAGMMTLTLAKEQTDAIDGFCEECEGISAKMFDGDAEQNMWVPQVVTNSEEKLLLIYQRLQLLRCPVRSLDVRVLG